MIFKIKLKTDFPPEEQKGGVFSKSEVTSQVITVKVSQGKEIWEIDRSGRIRGGADREGRGAWRMKRFVSRQR